LIECDLLGSQASPTSGSPGVLEGIPQIIDQPLLGRSVVRADGPGGKILEGDVRHLEDLRDGRPEASGCELA
jgi:hypothetical protein